MIMTDFLASEKWLFSDDRPPHETTKPMSPSLSVGYKNPWVYMDSTGLWFKFNYRPYNWEPRNDEQVPAQHRAFVLLIPRK